jgi:hypothetical protein
MQTLTISAAFVIHAVFQLAPGHFVLRGAKQGGSVVSVVSVVYR